MELEKKAQLTEDIHETLDSLIGQRVEIRANLGRSKIANYEGVLTQTYPAIFTVEVDRKRGRTARQSYQYVDVLTGVVELSQEGDPVFEELAAAKEEENSLFVPDSALLHDDSHDIIAPDMSEMLESAEFEKSVISDEVSSESTIDQALDVKEQVSGI